MRTQLVRIVFATICALVSLTVQTGVASAAPGDLDSTFDGDGKVLADFGGLDDQANGLASYEDGSGRLLVSGQSFNGSNWDLILVRFTDGGSIDATFGNAGVVRIDSGGNDEGRMVLFQPDGRIVVRAFTAGWESVLRFNSNGTLDQSFGVSGVAQLQFGLGNGSIALQQDGKIVAVNREKVFRLTDTGAFDSSFSSDGIAQGPLPATFFDIAISPSTNKIVAVGLKAFSTGTNTRDRVLVARFDDQGVLDPSFDSDGWLFADLAGISGELGRDVEIHEGKIVVAVEGSGWGVIRLLDSGQLDTSFDGDGKLPLGQTSVRFAQIEHQPDGRLVVAASLLNQEGDIWQVSRRLQSGSIDPEFGTSTISWDDRAEVRDLALRSDGKVIVAGTTITGVAQDLAIARYKGADSGPPPPTGQSDTATQNTLVDVTAAPVEGVLNIEVSQSAVDFGSVEEGQSSSGTPVGTLTYTNTLGASRSWDVTVAATDLVNGSNRIDFENLSFDAGDSITPSGPTVPVTGSTAFSGGDPEGFSDPHPLANAPSTAQGTFTHAGSTATLSVPFGTPAGNDYTGTLQYTITG